MFGEVKAVRGIDLDVGEGEMVGIVGESGSGQVGDVPRPDGPAAEVGAHRGLGEGRRHRARRRCRPKVINRVRGQRVAMIFQDPLSALNPVHQIGDQIVEMIRSHQDMSKKAAWARAVELLDIVGIPQPRDRASQYPHEFSGGMRQRVMIAMAIANDPEVLIADEPTTALDVTVQAQILEVLQRIRREMRTAIVLITHDLGVVARVADRVQVMYAGRAAERGDVWPIFDHPSHPYTQGLLSSLPALGRERLSPIPGAPPNMLDPPSGCAFRARCPYAIDACAEGLPELVPFGEVATACIRAGELAELRAAS